LEFISYAEEKTAVPSQSLFFNNLMSFKSKKSMKILVKQSQKTFIPFIFTYISIFHAVVGLVLL